MSENLNNKATRGSISQIILTALSSGSKYGYEICKDIEKLTKGKLILKQPSLYSSLRRMEEQNLITSYWEDSSLGGKRHYYTLTEKGKMLYEKNKDIWNNKDELLNNLPENSLIKENFIDEEINRNNIDNYESPTYVANQENLFNLTRNFNDEIKKIDNKQNNESEDSNKSFFQFDFFEQNIKFVKESNSNKNQEIFSFVNKFSDMDNHTVEIEPDSDKLDSNNKSSVKKEKFFETEPILYPTQQAEIKRQDVFTNEKIIEEITEGKDKNFNELKDKNMNNNPNNKVNLFEHIIGKADTKKQSEQIVEPTQKQESGISKNDNFFIPDEISWENNNLSDTKSPIFENKDYRGLIGKLYNNSQLKDPYEQNKYHTFKEIFPSSQLKEKEKQTEVYKESALDAIVESSTNSNIDCDDIKMLNNLYNLQGINIKIHSDIENKKQNKVYTDKNKLNMICSWVISILMFIEVLGTFFILKNQNLIARGQSIIYFLAGALILSYCIIFTLENVFDRFKLSIIDKKFNKTIIARLLLFIIMIIVIFALNLVFGMNNLMQVEYLSFWLIPTLLASNIVVQAIVYELLYKSKAFNS